MLQMPEKNGSIDILHKREDRRPEKSLKFPVAMVPLEMKSYNLFYLEMTVVMPTFTDAHANPTPEFKQRGHAR